MACANVHHNDISCEVAKLPWIEWCKSCREDSFRCEPAEFKAGDYVEIASVDTEGWTGRDPHPEPEMEGCKGRIIAHADREFMEENVYDLYWVRVLDPRYPHRYMFIDYELVAYRPGPATPPADIDGPTVESNGATIGVAAAPQSEPKGDKHMNRQLETIRALMLNGWHVDTIYDDNVVNMTKTYPAGDEVMVFVTEEGKVMPPRTSATMQAETELRADAMISNPLRETLEFERYYADTHGDDLEAGWFVFDRRDADQVCCGPFKDETAARLAANALNDANPDPLGLRTHQVQHELERIATSTTATNN